MVIGKYFNEDEWKSLTKQGYNKDNIIESTFTFELNPKRETWSRKDLGLPEDKFLLVVVGNRLNDDITDEYLNHIFKTFAKGTHLST